MLHFPPRSEGYMKPSTPSQRIKDTNTTNDNVENITRKLESSLDLKDKPQDVPAVSEVAPPAANEEDDWEQLADKELEAPEKPAAKSTPPPREKSPTILELYDFDPKLQMHQIVKSFTKIVDPTSTMPFRPKMVNDSILLIFSNPKHGIIPGGIHSANRFSNRNSLQLCMCYADESSGQTSPFRRNKHVPILFFKFSPFHALKSASSAFDVARFVVPAVDYRFCRPPIYCLPSWRPNDNLSRTKRVR
jgi:hypothetical protein